MTTAHEVRVSVQIKPQHGTYAEMRGAWRAADELGVDAIFNWDHFFPLSGDPDGLHYECWTTVAAMAEVTEQAQIGTLVVCNSYRNPSLVADMSRTIDHASNGRFILGIGAGWCQRDYDEYGYEYGTAPSRLRDFDKAMPIIRDRLTKLNPGPVAGNIPILIGGSGEKVTLRIVAQHANIWNGGGTPENAAAKSQILDDWCAKVGRDPSEIERSVVGSDLLIADPDAYVSKGLTHLIYAFGGPEWDLGPVRELIAWRNNLRAQEQAS